jgi:uncharacterized protein
MTLRPVGAGERIEVLDALRGAALFGIITANMRGFTGPLAAYFDHTLMWTDPVSRVAQGLVDIFIQGKFITLFAFMFGIGFAIQMERADRSGVASRLFYVRRLAILLVFGLLHFILIWWGDILAPYALLGFVLMLFRTRSQRALLRWAAVLYLYPFLLGTALFIAHAAGAQIPTPPPTTPADLQRMIGVYADGSYAAIIRQNIHELPFMVFGFVFFYPRILGVFLFGLWVWRAGIIQALPSKTALVGRCQKHGLWIGLLFNSLAVALNEVFHPNPMAPSLVILAVNLALTIGVPAGSLFYASTIALLWHKVQWRARLRPFVAVGRMALTNYLLQSLICTTLFYSWGLGLYGRVNPLLGFVPTIAIYAAQVVFSVWWLRHFAMGPMEWLWRRLTYGAARPVPIASAS